MISRVVVTIATLFACPALAQGPLRTDADKYRGQLENDCVRVVEYRDRPGDRTQQHRHPPFVLYAPGPFKRTVTLPNGKVLKREFKRGDVLWSEEQTHVGENVGQTPTHVVIVELKQPAPASGACSGR